ncbi:universal stress protein [Yinghuangia seranimata]|uniref:universal stress protein n=1 Tax=Yinghuangia seranimata TaxID=408067 RepID=UPI00248CA07D|nr:universal stress protein [Yinghuangia seranimata]MDI2131976.1 universal stress protein [Yinghuangia seranimata]
MRIVVGCMPDERGDDAVALAGVLARQMGAGLTLTYVQPESLPGTGVGAVDAEWSGYLRAEAAEVLDGAARRLAVVAPEVPYDTAVHAHRGSGRGLGELAEMRGAAMAVIGSAPGGRSGRVAVGSTADQLLHGSPVPVALAPAGFAASVPYRLTRTTLAFHRSARSVATLTCGRMLRDRLDTELRLLTVLARPRRLHSGKQHHGVDEQMLQSVRDQLTADLEAAADALGSHAPAACELAEGDDVPGALSAVDWVDEALVVSVSDAGPLTRVFVGDVSLKIIRAAQVPVVVFPRGARLDAWHV